MPGNDASSKPLQCSRRLPATNAASDRRVSTFPPGEKILIFRRSASHIQTMIGKLATRDNSECLAFRRFTPTFYLRVIFQRLCISSFQVSASPSLRVPASLLPRQTFLQNLRESPDQLISHVVHYVLHDRHVIDRYRHRDESAACVNYADVRTQPVE